MKKIIATVLAFVMILGTVAIGVPEEGFRFGMTAHAISGVCGDNLTWTLAYGTITVSGTGDMWDYNSSFPDWDNYSCSKIVISDGVTSIGERAFYWCGADTVEIADSVKSIGEMAFGECEIESIMLPGELENIDSYAFYGCKDLEEINISDDNEHFTAIDGILFNKNCTTLVKAPPAFVSEYTIPDTVTTIGEAAFQVVDYEFMEKPSLKKIIIPEGVVSIEGCAFNGCQISEVELPESLKTIGDRAFCDTALSSVHIPAGVTYIGAMAFTGKEYADGYEKVNVTIDEGNERYVVQNGALIDETENRLICMVEERSGEYIIPDGIVTIGENAFSGMSDITNIVIPDSVTTIEYGAFMGMRGVSEIVIPESVKTIGHSAFYMSSITSITVPEGVESIGDYAFAECFELKSVSFPASLKIIGDALFYYSFDVSSITVADGSPYFSSDGELLVDRKNDKILYLVATYDGVYTIPDGIKSIGSGAFENSRYLSGVNISDSVQEIGSGAFSGCGFQKAEINIPEGVTTIAPHAFSYCSSIGNLYLPSTLESIEPGAFAYTGVDKIYYNGSAEDWNEITIGNGNYVRGEGDSLYGEIGWGGLSRANLVLSEDSSNSFSEDHLGISLVTDSSEVNITSDTECHIGKVPEDDDSYFEIWDFGSKAIIFDIYFERDGKRVQPSKPVTMTIPVPKGFSAAYCNVFHFVEGKSPEILEVKERTDAGLVVEVTGFSYYAVVQTVDRTPGDVNSDGKVSMLDSTVLRRWLAGWDVTISEANADVNGDGKGDMKDSVILRRYLAGWPGVELK